MKEYATYRKRLDGTFIPSNVPAQEFWEKTKPGKDIVLEGRRPRSVAFHNRYFAILHGFYDHTAASEAFQSFEAFREYLVIKAGFYEAIEWPDGTIHLMPKSLAFGNMSQEEFEKLRNATANVLIKDILTDTDPQWVWEEIARF